MKNQKQYTHLFPTTAEAEEVRNWHINGGALEFNSKCKGHTPLMQVRRGVPQPDGIYTVAENGARIYKCEKFTDALQAAATAAGKSVEAFTKLRSDEPALLIQLS